MIILIILVGLLLFAIWLMGGGDLMFAIARLLVFAAFLWCAAIVVLAAHKVWFVL